MQGSGDTAREIWQHRVRRQDAPRAVSACRPNERGGALVAAFVDARDALPRRRQGGRRPAHELACSACIASSTLGRCVRPGRALLPAPGLWLQISLLPLPGAQGQRTAIPTIEFRRGVGRQRPKSAGFRGAVVATPRALADSPRARLNAGPLLSAGIARGCRVQNS